jgi:mannose-1-phosphate guanylyltransferase
MHAVYAVVMAGGRGERFWPLSTSQLAKPFIPLLGPTTLIQDTVSRLQPLVPPEQILISIGEAHHELARRQLPGIPDANFIVEPVGRDTAACLGLCAIHLEERNPESIMLAVPADHFVGEPDEYRRTLQTGIDHLPGATGVVFGVRPVRPDTSYGYICAQRPAPQSRAWPVVRFVEKPDAATAEQYFKSGDYFWNSGIFLWRNRTLLGLFQEHLPRSYQCLRELQVMLRQGKSPQEMLPGFASMERISVDFGIAEKTSGLRLVPVEFSWDDIGNWSALERALPADSHGNVARGAHVPVNTKNCIVYSDAGPVATFGVENLVVIQAYGKVLVCPKERATDLKRLVTALGPHQD